MAISQITIRHNGKDYLVNQTEAKPSWRIVHNEAGELLVGFQSSGITRTVNGLFEGTMQECVAQADKLSLTATDRVLSTGNKLTAVWDRPISAAPAREGLPAPGRLASLGK